MFAEVRERVETLDIFVANARPELSQFCAPPLQVTLEQRDRALDSQAKAFLVAVRETVPVMGPGGRIVAITYAPGAQKVTWQPWVAMGSAKSAMESLVCYFAATHGARLARERLDADGPHGDPGRHRERRRPSLHARGELDHGPADHRRRGYLALPRAAPRGDSAWRISCLSGELY
jgi:hypothetical protein